MSELLQLHLQQTYCLPILQYATAAVHFTQVQLRILNACWNNIYRNIFGFNTWESIRLFIESLGNLDFVSLRYLAMHYLYTNIVNSSNITVK
jgi:hypothetical protein